MLASRRFSARERQVEVNRSVVCMLLPCLAGYRLEHGNKNPGTPIIYLNRGKLVFFGPFLVKLD
jgi:hypothetical protein